MVAAVLKRSAFAVDACSNGREALAHYEMQQYGVIVLSLVTRDPDGDAELLKRLMELEGKPCVIALSAGSQNSLDSMASDLIAARLRKPFQIAELVEAVRRCFPGYRPPGAEHTA